MVPTPADDSASGTAGAAQPPAAPRVDSRAAWIEALRWGLDTAMARRARSITCVDQDLAAWPLDDPAMLQALTVWLRLPQRQLVLLAGGYDSLPRARPRFCCWRRDWAHAIQAWQAPAELQADLPSVLLDDAVVSVHLIDRAHGRGRAQVDARSALQWRERIDAILQRSEPGFAVRTLGL